MRVPNLVISAIFCHCILAVGCQSFPGMISERERNPVTVKIEGQEAPPGLLSDVKEQRIRGAVATPGLEPRHTPLPRNVAHTPGTMAPFHAGDFQAESSRTSARDMRNTFHHRVSTRSEYGPSTDKAPQPVMPSNDVNSGPTMANTDESTTSQEQPKARTAKTRPIGPLKKVGSNPPLRLKGTSQDVRGFTVAVLVVNGDDTVFVREGETINSEMGRIFKVTKVTPNSVQLTDVSTKKVLSIR